MLREERSRVVLGVFLLGMSVLHFLRPEQFDDLIPDVLPGSARTWTCGSGVAEAASGALLLSGRTARLGGLAALVTLAAVWVGNWKACFDGGYESFPQPLDTPAAAWARIPLQIPLLLWALRHARGGVTLRSRPTPLS